MNYLDEDAVNRKDLHLSMRYSEPIFFISTIQGNLSIDI